MEIKKIFSIYILFFLVSGYVIADNPGDEVVESQTEETTQSDSEAPAAESTGVSSSSGDEEVVQLQKVVVTGSRIKRTDLSGALPLKKVPRKTDNIFEDRIIVDDLNLSFLGKKLE